MKKKRLILSLLIIVITLSNLNLCSFTTLETANMIQFTSSPNNQLNKSQTNTLQYSSSTENEKRNYTVSSISVSIQNLKSTCATKASITITFPEKQISVPATGKIDSYDTNGYVGVLDAVISYNNKIEQLTLDFNYISKSETFSVLTIGCAGKIAPQIIYFGEFSSNISKLSALNVQAKKGSVPSNETQSNDSVMSTAVDATIRLQGYDTIDASGYDAATIAIYHANEIENQNTMSVYAKVNSHCSEFKSYLKNVHGFTTGSLTVYPDTYRIEIISNDKYLHSTGLVTPSNGSVVQNLTFPAYIPYYGWTTFGVPLTMSSTTVTTRTIEIGGIYNDNIVSWNIYKLYGWNSADIDGYEDDPSGGVVRTNYIYEGNVTDESYAYMGAFGQVRYEYVNTIWGSSTTLHMWSDEVLCLSELTVLP